MRFSVLFLSLALAASVAPAAMAAGSSLADRVERIDRLMDDLRVEIDSLRQGVRQEQRIEDARTRDSGTILGELMTEQQRVIARATRTTMRTLAASYAFNSNYIFGMGLLGWKENWGGRVDAGGFWVEDLHRLGANLTLLRSIDRFSAFGLDTHLYGFTGTGLLWVNRKKSGDEWYDVRDVSMQWQAGAGSEVSSYALGGLRFVPEVGLQAARFFSRHEKSGNFTGTVPESDFALDLYIAAHINFYFR